MQLRKFFSISGCLTVLALVYIHMQMRIFGLAYDHEKQGKHIRELVEKNGNATYTILRLKSANHIGEAMLQKDSSMQFMNPDEVVELTASASLLSKESPQPTKPANEKEESPLLSLVSFATRGQVPAGK